MNLHSRGARVRGRVQGTELKPLPTDGKPDSGLSLTTFTATQLPNKPPKKFQHHPKDGSSTQKTASQHDIQNVRDTIHNHSTYKDKKHDPFSGGRSVNSSQA